MKFHTVLVDRLYSWVGAAVLTTVLALAVASPASAITRSMARTLARHQQFVNCFTYGAPLWGCEASMVISPGCMLSVLPSGRGQWLCFGRFTQRNVLPIFFSKRKRAHAAYIFRRQCDDRVRYDQWGHRITMLLACGSTRGPLA